MNVALKPEFIAGKLIDAKTLFSGKSPVEAVKCRPVKGKLQELPKGLEVLGACEYAVRTKDGLVEVTHKDVVFVTDEGDVHVLPTCVSDLYEAI